MLEERLEEEEARLDNWMDTWCVMESGPDYPLEMAAKYHPERKGGGFARPLYDTGGELGGGGAARDGARRGLPCRNGDRRPP
ncbi:unnamed protein product [Pylaiella littoralis]